MAPLGLAGAAGTALVVDLDPLGPKYPGSASLADLTRRGPTRHELTPSRRGLAVLRNGGITLDEAAPIVEALMQGWPATVLRTSDPQQHLARQLEVVPLVPHAAPRWPESTPVYQQTGLGRFAARSPALPRASSSTVRHLARGMLPARSRWVRAWARIWEMA